MFDYLDVGQGNSVLFLLLIVFASWSVAELAGKFGREIPGGFHSREHEETGSTTTYEENN